MNKLWKVTPVEGLICLAILATTGFLMYEMTTNSHQGQTSLFLSEDLAKRVLVDEGYREISFEGSALLACGGDDLPGLKFAATTIIGKSVKGVVCGAPFKGFTIRRF